MVLIAACVGTRDPAHAPGAASEPPASAVPVAGESIGAGAAASTPAAGDTAGLDPRLELGRAVYRKQYCGICHRLDTAGTRGSFGPTHNAIGTTAEDRVRDPNYAGTATTAEAYIRESILDPAVYVVRGYETTRHRMPAYTALEATQLEALVHLLLRER